MTRTRLMSLLICCLLAKRVTKKNLLSVCYAFGEMPDVLKGQVYKLVKSQRAQPVNRIWNNGTYFKTLPGPRTLRMQFSAGAHAIQTIITPIGDFVSLNDGGVTAYVVSYVDSTLQCPSVSCYYRATFINRGHGWDLQACDTNLGSTSGPTGLSFYQFVPCP